MSTLDIPATRLTRLFQGEPRYTIHSPAQPELSGRNRLERLDRFENVSRIFCTPLASPDFVRTTNRQGGVFVQFLPVTGAESYEVTVTADANGNNVLRRETWTGEKNTEGFISIGNVVQQIFVKVRTICGDERSNTFSFAACGDPNPAASSTAAGAAEEPPEPINEDLGEDILPTHGQEPNRE